MGDNRSNSADSRVHLGDPGGGRDPGRRRGRQGVRGGVAVGPQQDRSSARRPSTRSPQPGVPTFPPRVRRDNGGHEGFLGVSPSAATPASTATSGPCAAPASRRSRASTRRARRLRRTARRGRGDPPDGQRGQVPGLADSKLLTAKARERCYDQVVRRALAWSVVVVGPEECDRLGMHVANVEALRRALARLEVRPSYVLTDGFPVDGLGGARARGVEGRPGRRLHRGRLGDRQGDPGPDHGRPARASTRRTTSRRTRATSPTTHTAALDEHGPCRCTGCGSSTSARRRGRDAECEGAPVHTGAGSS